MKISDSSVAEENDPAYKYEDIDHDDDQRDEEEETTIPETVKGIPTMSKDLLKSEVDQGIEQKYGQSNASATFVVVKTTGLAQRLQSEEGGNEKTTHQKVFITRMTMSSFSSLVAQLNKAQNEAVRSIGFTSFLKIDLK